MKCKSCKTEIAKDIKFCPYCGEKIEAKEEKKIQYKEDLKEPKSKKEIVYKDDIEEKLPTRNSLNSIIGLVFSLIAIPLCLKFYFGIIVAVIALIFSIYGYKDTNKGLGIASLLSSGIGLMISAFLTILLVIGNFNIVFSNNYETSIKNIIIDSIKSEIYMETLEDNWVNNNYEFVLYDDYYYLYSNRYDKTDNYYYGKSDFELGLKLKVDEYQFADDDYYYYSFSTYDNGGKIDGVNITNVSNLLTTEPLLIKLEKEHRNNLIIVNNETNQQLEFTRK